MSDSSKSEASGIQLQSATYVPGPISLAIDLGASGGRVIAGGVDGGKLKMGIVSRFTNGPTRFGDSMVWNPIGLWSEIVAGLRLAVDQTSEVGTPIASVGVDTWGVDFAMIDKNNQMVSPLRHYRDPRNRGMLDEAFATMPRSEIFAATGLQFMEINSLYQLLAAKKQGDSWWQSADSFLMAADLFHWLLSGKRTVEATNASTTQMLDPTTGTWSPKILQAFGLPSHWFAEPTPAGTKIGEVQPSVASATGLRGVSVIAPATHDTASAVLAVPADGFAPEHPDWCYISSGTWSLMGVELPAPKVNATCAKYNFTNEGGVRGSTRLLKNIGGLWIFQQIRAALDRRGNPPSWDAMVRLAKDAPAFGVFINPDDPSLSAPDDMIDAICAYAGRTGQRVPTDNGVLFRAALEGLALRYQQCLKMLEELVGNQIRTIHIVGGGSLNALLCQMTADACNRTVIAGPVEATAMGNVLMQMLGIGSLNSIDEARELVRNSFPTSRYEPKNPDRWSAPAEAFAKLAAITS